MANPLIDTVFHTQPDAAPCLQLADGTGIGYGELLARSGQVANTLVRCGVAPGDRVAAQIDKSPAAVALYLGTVRAGAAFLPLNTAYTPRELGYFLDDARPALLVCREGSETSLGEAAAAAGTRLETLDAAGTGGSWAALAESAPAPFETVTRGDDDLAAILYTSGTTGRAKGAMITHRNLASNAATLAEYWQFSDRDVLMHALPVFHTHGLFVAINTAMVAGASMLFLPRFDAAEVLSLLPRCTAMMGVPTFYTRLLALDDFDRAATAHVRLFVSGSAPMTVEVHRAFTERTGQVILERYGMTETNMNTSNPCDGERVPGTVGFPLPGVELRITDPDAQAPRELPRGEVGMIEVRGPNVFRGYWNLPEKTAEELRADGFFITGDLGMIDERGYVHIVGRGKDLIISGGFNVYPKEIETAIDRLPGVAESAVIGVAHPDFGEGVIAVLVAESGATPDPERLVASLDGELARYKLPKAVYLLDELPRNAMGKVQKNLLRERYADAFATGD